MRWPVVFNGMKATQIEEMIRIKIDPARSSVVRAFPQIVATPRRRSRRHRKLLRFVVWEVGAATVLLGCLIAGTSPQLMPETSTSPFVIGAIIAASALAIIPVLFFALPHRHDQLRRYRQ